MIKASMNPIAIHPKMCTGCRACEIACVFRREEAFGTSSARVRIVKEEAEGADIPFLCQLCETPACVAACPPRALHKDADTGIIVLDLIACTRCLDCRTACPYDSVFVHPETGLPLICDLCQGDPACVKRCSTRAIFWEK
jgi:carbon-monoxide dehydrogenase iron sulfur subunit